MDPCRGDKDGELMAKRYMTDAIDRGTTVVIALELEQDRQIREIRELLKNGRWKSVLNRVNVLRSLADLLDRRKGRATWYNARRD